MKNKLQYHKSIYFITFFLLTSNFLACTKNTETVHWRAEISANNMNSITDLFFYESAEKMQKMLSSRDSMEIVNYNKIKANQIASYIQHKFNLDVSEKFIDNPEGIVILGMCLAAKELEHKRVRLAASGIGVFKAPSDNMNCFMTAVSDLIGISQARSIWNSIVAGATEETVIAAVSLIGRRVGGILAVATMVYSTGECLGWW
ncbi:MAG: hypothetical protein RLZ56_149 [Bacteroidota bacterium]|jgi:hypothetical protein